MFKKKLHLNTILYRKDFCDILCFRWIFSQNDFVITLTKGYAPSFARIHFKKMTKEVTLQNLVFFHCNFQLTNLACSCCTESKQAPKQVREYKYSLSWLCCCCCCCCKGTYWNYFILFWAIGLTIISREKIISGC